jgi:ATP-dependent protease ClpP protease subunit
MKRNSWIAAGVLAVFLYVSTFAGVWSRSCDVRWEGGIDAMFLQQVRTDLDNSKGCKVLRVELLSPGGSVVHTLEVVHAMREAEKDGLIIEIHGGALIASGATFVLAAGSRSLRYVRGKSLTLVHGLQSGGMFGSKCVEYTPEPKDDSEKAINVLTKLMVQEYSELSGKSVDEVSKWLKCDNTQAGFGELLVQLGLADHVEE